MPATIEHQVIFEGFTRGMSDLDVAATQMKIAARCATIRIGGIGGVSIIVTPVVEAVKDTTRRFRQFINSEAQRIVDPILRQELSDNIEHEGHSLTGGHDAFSENTKGYNKWKEEQGYPLHKMFKTGKLAIAVDNAELEGSISGEVLSLTYSWNAWGPRNDPDWDWGGSGGGSGEGTEDFLDDGGDLNDVPF